MPTTTMGKEKSRNRNRCLGPLDSKEEGKERLGRVEGEVVKGKKGDDHL